MTFDSSLDGGPWLLYSILPKVKAEANEADAHVCCLSLNKSVRNWISVEELILDPRSRSYCCKCLIDLIVIEGRALSAFVVLNQERLKLFAIYEHNGGVLSA